MFIPPVVLVCCIILMAIVEHLLPAMSLMYFAFHQWIGVGLVFVAVLFIAYVIRYFHHYKTTVEPFASSRPSVLLTQGVFTWSRNPIYLAQLLLLIGVCFIFGQFINLIFVILFFFYLQFYQIPLEEQTLTEIFHHQYQEYCCKVRRWL